MTQKKSTSADPIHRFTTIPIGMPEKMIRVRLGYHRSKTIMLENQQIEFDTTMREGFALCEPAGCWRRVPILENNGSRISFAGDITIISTSLAQLLEHSQAAVFMGATVGGAIVTAAKEAIAENRGSRAVILDAVGGQSADSAIRWINEYIRQQLKRLGQHLTSRRFSPGYGDLGLESQKSIFTILELHSLGLELSPRWMLVPEKSVTAIAGIEKKN